MKVASRKSGFTLVEMLVVISILGILAGLAVPALKNLGKSDANIGASRQLLDDVGRARQFAISRHTTVYMVFVPTNFWGTLPSSTALINLCDKQLSGYTFVSLRSVGDQPGQSTTHYITPWQNLPDGTFIAEQKFSETTNQSYTITDAASGNAYYIDGFNVTTNVPFPTETSADSIVPLPYIAFNYLGQLVSGKDEYIPLAHGSVSPAINPDKTLQLSAPTVSEIPPGNSTNSAYNIVHINWLTGRATLEYEKVP